MRQFIVILALLGVLGVRPESSAQLIDKDFVSALQEGGYIIYMRHPRTNPDQSDTDPLNLENIKAQRQLTDEGRKQAQAIGEAFRMMKIAVHKVISSRFYRAYEAAK